MELGRVELGRVEQAFRPAYCRFRSLGFSPLGTSTAEAAPSHLPKCSAKALLHPESQIRRPRAEVRRPRSNSRCNEPAANLFWRGDSGGFLRELGQEEVDEGAGFRPA